MLRGKPRPIAEILKIVEKLDQPATTTDSTQVIPLPHADAANVATILGAIISGKPRGEEDGAQETTIQADETLNAIVVRADPGSMSELLEIIRKLDVRRSQVLIEAAIVEITIDKSIEFGVEMAAAGAQGETVPFATTSLQGVISSLFSNLLDEDGQVDVLTGLASVSNPTIAAAKIDADAISFGAVVTALATNSQANLLSTPSILTLDNKEASILVGREVPFRTGSFTTTGDGTSNPFTTVQREDVGVELKVTPHVHDDSAVRLEVEQEITNVLATPVGGEAFADVVTSKRAISTTILAEDRQTIVLGGLIQDDLNRGESKVPLLGDIPVLGNLFKSRSKTNAKTNLLVFLRPTVIRSKEDAARVTDEKYGSVWEVEIKSSGHDADALFNGERPEL